MPTPAADPLSPATADDVDALAALWAQAFPSRSATERARELREGLTYGTLRDCWVARVAGDLVGALRTYRLTLHARGNLWPTLGLAAVAVAPDHRRRCLARRVWVQARRVGRDRGCVLAALYPFRTSFYADLGFTLVGTLLRHRFAPADLPLYAGWDRVRRASPDDADVRSIYEQVARRSTGLIDRPDEAWRFLSEARTDAYVHRGPEGEPTGYAVARTQRSRTGTRMRVLELLALDVSAHEALLGWISAQRDQYGEVVYDALPEEGLDRRLRHPRRPGSGRPRGLWMDTAVLLRGPMLRLLDPAGAQAADDPASCVLRDPALPELSGRWIGGERVDTLDDRRPGDQVPGAGDEVLGPGEAAERLLEGRMPGQLHPDAAWRPIPFGEAFRLLDEF